MLGTSEWIYKIEMTTPKTPENFRSSRGCENKRRYETNTKAEIELQGYRSRILFSNMNTYWCHIHKCYHLGHSRQMQDVEIIRRDQLVGNLYELDECA